MYLSEYDITNPVTATLVASERITPPNWEAEVRHLVLELPPGAELDFVEGQSIGVLAPGPHAFGNAHHLRLYSIASSRKGEGGKANAFSICVRRCFYLDEISGEQYPGVASNFLCDAQPGAPVQVTGPYGAHFSVPADASANMLMVGVGTGIAPFRAFVRHIYEERGGWKGKVRLYYGAKSGMELLYRNEHNRDMALYYDDASFKAFEAVSPRPAFDHPPALDNLLLENREEIWELVDDPKTYVFVAGLENAKKKFDKAMASISGSEAAWQARRADLVASGRYSELIY